MQILVTGASGRIGRYVVKELVSAGHNVTGVDILASEGGTSRFLRTKVRDALPNHISPMTCAKAEAAFGYQPRYLWSVSERHLE